MSTNGDIGEPNGWLLNLPPNHKLRLAAIVVAAVLFVGFGIPHGCIFRMVLPIGLAATPPLSDPKTTDRRSPHRHRAGWVWRRLGSIESPVDADVGTAAASQSATSVEQFASLH